MASHDTGTLTISRMNVAQHDILRLTTPESAAMTSLNAMDPFDHDLNFDADLLDNTMLPSLPFTPSYELSDAFSTTFEDPFSYHSGAFESLLDDNHMTQDGDTASADPDNKLLGFGPPILKAAILDDAGQTWPTMSAELYGMFFVAEDVFGGDTAGRPLELTCYRRNLFQISGSVTLSRSIAHMLNEQGHHVPVFDLTATISALESIEGKSTEIISVPWKSTAVVQTTIEDKAGAAPPKWPLDLHMNPEMDPRCVAIPIAWKRLQFKHATANNGRRKGLQQHYVIQINLIATLATGESVKVAEIQSGPIIVRGRSPRNFDSRKDVPLSEGARKGESKTRTMSDSTPPLKVDPSATTSSYQFYALNQLQQPLDLPDWTVQNSLPLVSPSIESPLRLSKKSLTPSSTSSSSRPPVPKTKWKTEATPTKPLQLTSTSAPIDLSLADDEFGNRSGSQGTTRGFGAESPEAEKRKGVGSPLENLELLYEYFPLSLDDWMPPVDAIYRPHVVHHTIVPPDLKAEQIKNKTKRYFSADD